MTSISLAIFPFERNRWYSFQDFVLFEDNLFRLRRTDHELDNDLRTNRRRWIKVRNEELIPAWHLCKHLNLLPAADFLLCEGGSYADIELRTSSDTRRLQITTAGPIWRNNSPHWGQDYILHMEQLNREGSSSGWGPYVRQSDGSITNRQKALDGSERDAAYGNGLQKALQGKQRKQHSDCELVVLAKDYNIAMSEIVFQAIATSALNSVALVSFSAVHILCGGDGYYVRN